MEKFSDKIAEKMFRMGMLSEKEREYCNYFLLTRFEQTAVVAVIFLLALIFGQFFQTLLFWVFFRGLRSHSGGFHAATFFGCAVGSVGIYVLFALFGCDFMRMYPRIGTALFMMFSIAVLTVGAVNNKDIDWNEAELTASRKRVRITATIEIIAVIVTYMYMGGSDYVAYMAFAVILCGILLFMGMVTQRKEEKNEL